MHIVLHHQDIYINHIQHLILNSMHFTFSAQVRSWHLEAQWVELEPDDRKKVFEDLLKDCYERGDDLFLNIIGNKLPMFSQQRFASPHSQKHILPTLVALRPDPAAESCVDPQTVDNCVECSIVSYLVPSFCLVRLAIMEFLLHWLGM